jgi:hypothetical protein
VRAYLEVRDPIEIGIQIFEICKGGNLGVFDDACFSLHLRRFTNVVGAKSDLRRSRALAARNSLRNIRYQRDDAFETAAATAT